VTVFAVFRGRYSRSKQETITKRWIVSLDQLAKGMSVTCVLCVDDNRDVLQMLVDVLRNSGYATLTAASGEQALRVLLQRNTVDLVILDYEMPTMRGDLVAQEIRRRRAKLPIILFTGVPDDIPSSLREIVDAVVYKADFTGLLTAVASLTEMQKK